MFVPGAKCSLFVAGCLLMFAPGDTRTVPDEVNLQHTTSNELMDNKYGD